MTDQNYQSALNRLSKECPILGRTLALAEKTRCERLPLFLEKTGRLQGLEEYSGFLDAATNQFRNFPDPTAIPFLLARARADFVTAIEAALSGFHVVAWESMRDVMEIEALLREFAEDRNQMQKWISSSQRTRRNDFSHSKLRERRARRLGLRADMLDDADYRGHNVVLHVNPGPNPFGQRGLSRADVGADACFWDIYRHAWNLFQVILELLRQFGESRDIEGWKEPTVNRFTREYQEAMDIQRVFMDKLKLLESDEDDNAEDRATFHEDAAVKRSDE